MSLPGRAEVAEPQQLFENSGVSFLVSEELAKIAAITPFGMKWIDITYLYFNELRAFSG